MYLFICVCRENLSKEQMQNARMQNKSKIGWEPPKKIIIKQSVTKTIRYINIHYTNFGNLFYLGRYLRYTYCR